KTEVHTKWTRQVAPLIRRLTPFLDWTIFPRRPNRILRSSRGCYARGSWQSLQVRLEWVRPQCFTNSQLLSFGVSLGVGGGLSSGLSASSTLNQPLRPIG